MFFRSQDEQISQENNRDVSSIQVTVTIIKNRYLCIDANTLASFVYYSIFIAYDATCI